MQESTTPFRGDEIITAEQVYELARFLLLAETVAVAVLILWMAYRMGGWRTMDAGNRFRLSGGFLLQVALGYGALEATLTGVNAAPRNLIAAIADGYLGIAYVMTIMELRRSRGDSDGT